MILDRWLFPERADGSPLMPGITVTPDLDRDSTIQEVFADYIDIVRICEWEQHDVYPLYTDGPVNVWVREWRRPPPQA
jgi:hypothetical protein